MCTEQYFSSAMEVWRGLHDLGRVYQQQKVLSKHALPTHPTRVTNRHILK